MNYWPTGAIFCPLNSDRCCASDVIFDKEARCDCHSKWYDMSRGRFDLTVGNVVIVSIADRPDLATVVAEWLWAAFWKELGYSCQETQEVVASGTSQLGPPQTFVLLANGTPVGTASLAKQDLDERPDLSPWLADVFVVPESRGLGYVGHLITAVENSCVNASIPTLWLHTHTAERIYARLGWNTVEYFDRRGHQSALMQRQLTLR